MCNRSFFFSLFFLVVIGFSCQNESTKQVQADEKPLRVKAPDFNADTAYYYVDKQVAFGPRVLGTAASKSCAIYLTKELRKYIPEVIVQQANVTTYDGKTHPMNNIIGVYNPQQKKRILLCAHWDSRHIADYDKDPAQQKNPILGANDGASGVGVLMEVARVLAKEQPEIGVDIIFFDAEDYGAPEGVESAIEDSWCLGAQYWAKNPHKQGYSAQYGILLDMVGASNATFTMEGTSLFFAPTVMRNVWSIAHDIGYSTYFSYAETGPITDDHLYINQILGIPTIDIIHRDLGSQTGFFPHWHTQGDDMSTIDKKTLKAVGQTVLQVIYQEAQ